MSCIGTKLLIFSFSVDMAEFLKAAVTNVPTLAGIKFTHNNLEEGSRCLRINDGKFSVFLGNDYVMYYLCSRT